MAADRKTPGESITSRLASRSARAPLQRRSMPGGGEVWEGPLASKALKALGARAMTVDSSIIVGDDFDPSSPESQALYAHEQYHQQVSGGAGSHHAHDAEEQAARAVEGMVLHRAATGGTEVGTSYAGAALQPQPSGPDEAGDAGEGGDPSQPDPEQGYQALLAQGMEHQDIIDKLASACVDVLDEQDRARFDRAGHLKGGF